MQRDDQGAGDRAHRHLNASRRGADRTGHLRQRLHRPVHGVRSNQPKCEIADHQQQQGHRERHRKKSRVMMPSVAVAKGSESLARQALFLTHRDRIEQIASDLYDASPPVKGAVIRIFTKHVEARS